MSRPTIDVAAAPGGWPSPWPNVAELADALPPQSWTLVGGLMVQLHAMHHGLGVVRPTNDVDVVLHIETTRGVPQATADALDSIGYRLLEVIDPRENTAHRFVRGDSRVDLVSGGYEVVDVLIADHASPRIVERLRGRDMVRIDGGTQALRRTVNARLELRPGIHTTVSVPNPFGALVLKAAAYRADSRDPERHLQDAVALLACLDDPLAAREEMAGSDRSRLGALARALPATHPAWQRLETRDRAEATAALRILCAQV